MGRREVSSTLDFLLRKYGPSLTLEDLAEVLKRKPSGVRSVLSRNEDDWAKEIINPAIKSITHAAYRIDTDLK